MIPEADYSITFTFDGRRSRRVHFAAVLSSVDLDDELCRVAGEIDDEMTDRDLPAEMMLLKSFSQQPPKLLLGIGRAIAQTLGSSNCTGWRMMLQ